MNKEDMERLSKFYSDAGINKNGTGGTLTTTKSLKIMYATVPEFCTTIPLEQLIKTNWAKNLFYGYRLDRVIDYKNERGARERNNINKFLEQIGRS